MGRAITVCVYLFVCVCVWVPGDELFGSTGTQLYEGSLLLCCQVDRLLRVEVGAEIGRASGRERV